MGRVLIIKAIMGTAVCRAELRFRTVVSSSGQASTTPDVKDSSGEHPRNPGPNNKQSCIYNEHFARKITLRNETP